LEAWAAWLAVLEVQRAGPSTGQQQALQASEAWAAWLAALEVRRAGPSTGQQQALQALEAWAAFLEEREGQHQASEAWAAFQGVLEVRQWAALVALVVGREALVVFHRSS
jgi:hypothetical protein